MRAAALWALAAAFTLAVGACSPSGGSGLAGSVRVLQGNFRFGRGEDTAASLAYLRALRGPDGQRWGAWITYDLGTQYVALGELQAGLRRLGAGSEPDPTGPRRAVRELAFRRAFNLGVARFEAGEFEEAAWSFIEALRRKPGSWDAKYNLELSIRSSLGSAGRGAELPSPKIDPRGGEQARRQLARLHEQEEPSWMSAPSTATYARDW